MASSNHKPPAAPQGNSAPQEGHTAALHETTNALTVILGWIERARQAGAQVPGVVAALERASRTAMTTRNALRRTIGASVADEPPERVDSLTRRAVDDLLMEARRADVDIQVAIDSTCAAYSVTEPNAAWQILTNLILNAIAATPPKGLVQLSATPAADGSPRVQFRVTDDGPGIPAPLQEGLFSEGVSGREDGAGIGLWHAHRLARRHGGQLAHVEVDRGARFDLDWPCEREAPPSVATPASNRNAESTPAARSGSPGELRGRRILLLEDDDAVVELLELTLASKGADLTVIRGPDDLPAVLRDRVIDTLLVDLSPLNDSIDGLVEQARSITPDLAVIVISGRPVERSAATAWVRKPFEPSELVAAITRAGGRRDDG